MSEHFASTSADGVSAPKERFSDGLTKMQRWERDRDLPETMDIIVQRLCDGEEMPVICKSRGWPFGKVMQWLLMDEERSRQFRDAWKVGAYADISAAKSIAMGSENTSLAVATLWRGAEVKDSETFGKKMKVERSVSVTADVALVGLAGDMLAKIRELPNSAAGARIERVIDAESVATDAEV